MELWDLYTKDKIKINETLIRGNPVPLNKYHLVVHVWIKNSKGKYLISQRSEFKNVNPLKFECVGGSVLKGENSLQAALRETKEEVGIELNPDAGTLIFSEVRKFVLGKISNSILDVYLFKYDGKVNLKKSTTNEVKAVKWMTIKEIYNLQKSHELVSTLSYCFEKVFTIDSNYKSLQKFE